MVYEVDVVKSVHVAPAKVASRAEDLGGLGIPIAADHRPLWYRGFEIVASALALIVSLPVMLIVAVLVKIDSPGPILFTQQRVARGGRTFTFVKFRTMAKDGNTRFPRLSPAALRRADTASLRLSFNDDPRVTRLGKWLRRTSIDELPNFIHVIMGDMALVGPRPEMPEILPHYSQEELEKFSVKPGITGYAQIYGRGELSFQETVAYDLDYVRERSLKVDFYVLAKTVLGVVGGRGAWVILPGLDLLAGQHLLLDLGTGML